jgi:ribosomal protein S11
MAQKNSKFMKKKMAQKNSKFMKKNHFYFIGRYKTTKVPKAIFTFNISFSNIFLTLLDMKRRVVCSKSTGMSNLGNSKRKKLSTQTIDILAKQFLKYLRFYKVKMITLIIKSSMHKFI